MRIILTNHARQRAKQRGVSIAAIWDCVLHPDSVDGDTDSRCYKKVAGHQLLLVYTKDADGNIVVITVIKTSKIEKYM
jgi:hypothetical protein